MFEKFITFLHLHKNVVKGRRGKQTLFLLCLLGGLALFPFCNVPLSPVIFLALKSTVCYKYSYFSFLLIIFDGIFSFSFNLSMTSVLFLLDHM